MSIQHLVGAVSAVMVSVTFPSTSNAAAVGAGELALGALTRHCRGGHSNTHTFIWNCSKIASCLKRHNWQPGKNLHAVKLEDFTLYIQLEIFYNFLN